MHARDRVPLRSFALEGGGVCKDMGSKINPRYKNGSMRRKHRARLKALGGECGICKGRLGPIHYDEPSDAQHPFSFVVDEIIPVSRWKEFGYDSPEAVAQDWNNLQPAHYCCNQAKSNKLEYSVGLNEKMPRAEGVNVVQDGDW